MSKHTWLAYNSKVHFLCVHNFSATAILIFDFGFSSAIRSSSTPNLSSSETPGSSDLASDFVR